MKLKEKELFFELCKFKAPNYKILKNLVDEYSTSSVLGELFFNRMAGVAYGVLKEGAILGNVTREFRTSLANAYEQNTVKNKSFLKCVMYLNTILKKHSNDYAFLKGAYLCSIYPAGFRTSNDIDLLVRPQKVSDIGKTLVEHGFKQGNIKNGEFIPATRREIIESKMTRGETVPYIKEMDLPFFKYLEVDLNFSLDYKNSNDDTVEEMIDRAVNVKQLEIPTLEKSDFFIHLCCHLYKEATTMPWVKMRRDMTLYKYLDIYMLLFEATESDITDIFIRANELGVSDICACVIMWTCDLFQFQNIYALKLSENILKHAPEMLNSVISPAEHKTYLYTEKDILKRFFTANRISLLTERNEENEKTQNEEK